MNAQEALELPSHEALSQLAQNDPQAYEVLRRDLIDSFIASAPERIKPRLAGIQFQVENLRRLSGSPLGATVKLYELMWKSFLGLNHNWQDLVHSKAGCVAVQDSYASSRCVATRKAQVLAFRPRPRD